MKACVIYKTEKEYKIVTESESNTGLGLEDEPIFILPIGVNIANIKEAIFKSLNSSRKNVRMPKDWKEWQKEQLNKMKEKTFIGLYKKSNSVGVCLENNILTVYPCKYMPKMGLVAVKEDTVKIECSLDNELEITKKILEILEVDYK